MVSMFSTDDHLFVYFAINYLQCHYASIYHDDMLVERNGDMLVTTQTFDTKVRGSSLCSKYYGRFKQVCAVELNKRIEGERQSISLLT